MIARRTLLPVATASAAVVVVAAVFAASMASSPASLSPSCDSLAVTPKNSPFTGGSSEYVCGRQSVSDGRLSITLNGYRIADGKSIDWQCPADIHNGSSHSCSISDFLLLVNATIQNVGSGNTSIGLSFWVWLSNSAGAPVENGEFGANALFPGQHPNASIPSQNGGLYLPPGAKASYWLIFVLPGVNQSNAHDLSLQYLMMWEQHYGGKYEGGGAFACGPCERLDVHLTVTGAAEAQ
jgi:hypothetical protein